MTLRQIEFFMAISEKKSISKAASQFYLSTQAISRAITELESELGVPLFIRTHSGMQLTEYGLYMYKEINKVYPTLTRLPVTLRRMKDEDKEVIALTVAYGVTSSLTPKTWQDFEARHPNISLQITDQPDLKCEELLSSKEADVICTIGPVNKEYFVDYLVKTEIFYLPVHHEHHLYHKDQLSIEDFKDERFIQVGNMFRSYYNFFDYCKKKKFTPDIRYTSNEFNLLQEMTENNEGIFPMPEHTVNPKNPGMRYVPLPGHTWKVFFAVRKDEPISYGVDALIKYVLKSNNISPAERAVSP